MAATKSAISFGLVYIPIQLSSATQDIDIHFNQLHKKDKSRIRYKKVCVHCGEEVMAEDIVKGFEYDKDKYVIISDSDIEKIKTEKDKSIQILNFSQLDEISPVYFDKTYHATPASGGEKAFELLRAALMEEQKVAIAKTVMGAKETLIALIARKEGLIVQTMFFDEEIKLLPSYKKVDVVAAELQMAKLLVTSMVKPFDVSEYHDEYQQKLRDMIESKIEGKAYVVAKQEQVSIVNLMDALKQSLEQVGRGA